MKTIVKIIVVMFVLLSLSSYSQEISTQELNDMKYMVEEEKVARDVYDFLGEKWDLRVFNNIKQSEQRHIEMMQNLLEQNKVSYQLSNDYGKFYNEKFQKMYDDLVAKGKQSAKDALEVGKMIEEKDIADLKLAIEKTDDAYAKNVYTNLLEASYNHLNAFDRNLSRY